METNLQELSAVDYAIRYPNLPDRVKNLTGEKLERAIRAFEYDLRQEHIAPYIVDLSKELPEPKPLISVGGATICSRGNISVICGEAKSKKTFLCSALVASAMAIPVRIIKNFGNVAKDCNLMVLWIDTEQGEHHVRKVVRRISEMTGAIKGGAASEPRLTTLSLRELSPAERKAVLLDAIQQLHYDIVVVDGIADMQRNTNDLEESDALICELMALSTQYNFHILTVLHTNPGSDKARGHLGSSLQRKAETVIYVHRVGETSVVEPQFCRNEPFERFAFRIDENGIPELCDIPAATESTNPVIALLTELYGGAVERTVLSNKLVERLGLKPSTASMRIKRMIDSGELTLRNGVVSIAGYAPAEGSTEGGTEGG